ncbi:chromophore lyase CpcT/CpeT [Tumidithrix elongata RA019]|uniref:Chromophore lyase CpcT/CpeT n=1 Tax=Tumidithrix elongata BACA0141 TaxID=2716417 RepID=A0AAW9PUR9_9CYAN|nr:chromophore lyase CpcT/CpeT [Tumidithrix elongata RA019]
MNRKAFLCTALALGVNAIANTSAIAQDLVSSDRRVQDVASRLIGAMDTSAQAKINPKAPNVRMTTCKIRVENATSANTAIFLYQEQAMSQDLAKPYRQRFLRISPSADGSSIQSAIFKIPNSTDWIGRCSQPEAKRVVQLSSLGDSQCSVFLKSQGEKYIGETQAGGCPSNHRGAVKITNRIVLHKQGMDTWDRGFDAKGKLVWGATNEAYQFRWIDRIIHIYQPF